MAEFKNHVLQCYQAMSNRHLSRRRIVRRDAWTARNNVPMLFWSGRPGCRFKSYIKALALAHEPLCYLQVMHFAPQEVPYPLLPSSSEMRITDEDVWSFLDAHQQALRGIQRFRASAEGVRLCTAFVAGKMPEDRWALQPIPRLRPALRRRLPTEAQRSAHAKKGRSPT